MSAIGRPWLALLLLVIATNSGVAQELSAVERTTADFYGAIGPAVEVTWSAEPRTIPLNGELTLILIIRNAVNPHQLTRPDLHLLDSFTKSFQVLDTPPPNPIPMDATEVRFTYRLVPNARGMVVIPALAYAYFRPELPEGKRFKTTYAEAISITVTGPTLQSPTTPVMPIEAPESFFQLEEIPERTGDWPLFSWLVPIGLTPLFVGGWVIGWRRFFPDSMRMAKLRRIRAVRVVLKQLKRANSATDPAAETALAFRRYLTARFSMTPFAQTPEEVHAALTQLLHPNADAARNFLWQCDTTRFAATSDNALSLPRQAEALVLNWEGVRQ